MSWHMVSLADVTPSPWRNGGGVTRELARWPQGGDWIWRMSVAEVAQSGPFSRFEGVQRWFAVIAGAGVRLAVDAEIHALTTTSAPFCFDGAKAVDCQLVDGPTQDFNLMVRPDQAPARMKRVSGDFSVVLDKTKLIAMYPIDTPARVHFEHKYLDFPENCLVWRHFDAGDRLHLSAANTLWMEIEL
jgi:environmental stress-induced protein Ves